MRSKLIAATNTLKANADLDILFAVFYGGMAFAVILTFIGGFR